MRNISAIDQSNSARVLMFSNRNTYASEVFRCSLYEFEEIIRQIDSVDILAPKPKKRFRKSKRNAMRIAKYFNINLNPGIPKVKLDKYYDLFFAICQFPSELLHVNIVEGWKDYCKTSVCLLDEMWLTEMPYYESSFKILSKFDYVVLSLSQNVGPFSKKIQSECYYLPPGVDTLLFCPYPKLSKRSIDVLSFGRRAEKTHRVLLRIAEENKIFYVYDTLCDLHTHSLDQHRFFISNMAKRSRYFIVNPGQIDCPQLTKNQSEIGARYFEGAASGTIMIGEQPRNDEFKRMFFWPDALVQLPYNSENIEEVICEMDRQPDRQEQIRKNNVVHSLLQHDWSHRWEAVLKIAGLEPLPELMDRKKRLQDLANIVEKI